jgi:hypothetical protein
MESAWRDGAVLRGTCATLSADALAAARPALDTYAHRPAIPRERM